MPCLYSIHSLSVLLFVVCLKLPRSRVPTTQRLVATMTVALTKLVGIQRSAACTRKRTNRCPFLATGQAPYAGAAQRRSRHGEFISMLLPEGPMTPMPSRLRGRRAYRTHREDQRQQNQDNGYIPLRFLNYQRCVHPASPLKPQLLPSSGARLVPVEMALEAGVFSLCRRWCVLLRSSDVSECVSPERQRRIQ